MKNILSTANNVDAIVEEAIKSTPNRKVIVKNYAVLIGKSFVTGTLIGLAAGAVTVAAAVAVDALTSSSTEDQN